MTNIAQADNTCTVEFLVGRAKSGKTHEILRRIHENEIRGEKSLLIVPSGYTFECEKQLARFCGGGFMNTTICGFYNFGQKVLMEACLDNAFITEQGRIMVIRRSLETAENELSIFAGSCKQSGFATVCDEIISNFVTCELSPDMIFETAERMPQGSVLREKLIDLAKIYKLTDDYLHETGQILRAASETICELIPSSTLCNAHIYIDSIENPGDQTYRMITAMLKRAKSITIAQLADIDDTSPAFMRANEIYMRLRSVIKESGTQIRITPMKRDKRYSESVFEHIESELFKYVPKKYAGDSSCISIIAADNIKAEVDTLTAAVQHCAKCGTRYRNMAIVAANPDNYNVLVKRSLARANIPCFCDSRLPLSSTCAAALINSALRCITSRYKGRDIIALMKTGLANVTRDEAEILENYIIAYDISGSDFLSPFSFGKQPASAEDTRQQIIEPLRKLQSDTSRKTTAEKCHALKEYLVYQRVPEQLESIVKSFEDEALLVEAKQYKQVWGLIEDMLFQLESVMGESVMSLERFASIVEEGLCADIIGIIPSGVDMVSYSGIQSTMPENIDYLFIIGATEDDFPPHRADEGIIDDKELVEIKNTGLPVWLSVEVKTQQDTANLYKLFSTADKGLYVSYPSALAGKEKTPSRIIDKLLHMLDKSCISSADLPYKHYTIEQATADMRRLADINDALVCGNIRIPDIPQVNKNYLAWFLNSTKHKEQMQLLTDTVFFNPSPTPLDRKLATEMFEVGFFGNATRLEAYNKCPFSHFVQYGLKAHERKEYKEKQTDTGSVCHMLIDAFVKYVIENEIPYAALTDSECSRIIYSLAPAIVDKYNEGIFNKNSWQRAKKEYIISMARDTVQVMMRQMRSGSFEFLCSEASFGSGKNDLFPPIKLTTGNGIVLELRGKIDRIDSYIDENNETNLRIIDYKSSDHKFNFSQFYAGLQIQLPLYLAAVSCVGDIGCGMFYMHIQHKKASKSTIKGELEGAIMKEFRLNGLLLEDAELILAMDKEKVASSSSVFNSGKGSILPKQKIDAIKAFAIRKAQETAQDILEGKLPTKPFKQGSGKTACTYCLYNSICMFDEEFDCSYKEIRKITADTIFDEIV